MTDTAHRYEAYDWFPTALMFVHKGDIYANHGSVTVSRPARKGEWWEDKESGHIGRHTIKCGKSLRLTSDDYHVVIVGRKKQS